MRQQKAVDLITQCYQQMHMLSAQNNTDYRRMLRIFQEALDLQEHIRSVCISRKRCKSWSSVAMRKRVYPLECANRRRSPARAG
ncbi:FUSC family membrane protein [Escherichia coli]